MLAVVVTLPVRAVKLPVYVGKNASTLALAYVSGSPVSCEPLPRIKLPETLAVVVISPVKATRLPVYVGRNSATSVLLYMPVSCDPFPTK